jgi:hypothetical protein
LCSNEIILQAKGQQVTSLTGNNLRTLGPGEHYFWLSKQNSAKHFVIAAEIVEDAPVEASAQLRHPLLRVLIEQGPEGQPCFCQHADIPIPLRIVPQRESAAWHVEMAKELATPIPANGHPACTYHRLAKEWWLYASSFNASFHCGWAVFRFRHTRHP